MVRVSKATIDRMARSTLWVEQHGRRVPRDHRTRSIPLTIPWFGIVKEKINHKATGEVWAVEGTQTQPIESTEEVYTVANPYMGMLIDGLRVMCTPARISGMTGDARWFVQPMPLIYEGKATTGITSNSSGTVRIWQGDVDLGSGHDVTAHLRWVDGGEDISAGKKVRIAWDILEQRFYIDAKECEA